MKRQITAAGLAVLLVGLALVAGTGAVAAQESSSTIIDEEVTINNDTEAVWYEVAVSDNTSGDTLNASVTYYGLEEGQDAGNGTELGNETISDLAAGETTTGEYSISDGEIDSYERVRIHVNGSTTADADLVASTDYGTTERVSGGGGGGFLPGGGGSLGLVAVVAIIGGGLYMRD